MKHPIEEAPMTPITYVDRFCIIWSQAEAHNVFFFMFYKLAECHNKYVMMMWPLFSTPFSNEPSKGFAWCFVESLISIKLQGKQDK